MTIIKNDKGVVMILLLVVIGITSFIFFFGFARTSLMTVLDLDEQIIAVQTKERLTACVDEVLIRLQNDSTFNTTTINMVSYNCGVNISGNVSNTTVNVSTTYKNIERGIELNLTLDPVVIQSLEERLN
ncbi:MAG: hypothetical protein L3J07_04345 [Candidatus Magasanikbacteria bacterium]|nr:hypothetical protein [Candidatus Magasanikbacteria bacterium]